MGEPMKLGFHSPFNVSRIVLCGILVFMVFTAFSLTPVFAQTEGSTAQGYENVNVDTAYSMITNGSFPNLVILDVRFKCEYNSGHLYNAILIPCNELEMRIDEFEEHKNDEVIIYCRSGYRSQIACEILVNCNFTKVYNMLGGILAWIETGYPIWTTSHYVTVNIVDEEIFLQIEPLLLHQTGCVPCSQNQTCPCSSNVTNVTYTVLELEENYTSVLLAYEVNGTTYDITIAKTLLQSYEEVTDETNRTLNLMFTEITTNNSSMEFYSLSYLIRHIGYNLTLYTTFSPPSSETCNSSFTIMKYAPAENSEVTSFEFVEINSSVTLSELYGVLRKVSKKIGDVYKESDHESLTFLAQAYYTMSEEAKNLAKLMKNQLRAYDYRILHSSAVLMDPEFDPGEPGGGGGGGGSTCTYECWASTFLGCFGYIDEISLACIMGMMSASLGCGPLYPACLWAGIAACGVIDLVAVFGCAMYALGACCL
jgi:rhodanese-related sulfurtransferase